MEKTLYHRGEELTYELTYKSVKNLNLRVSPDGKVSISAPRRVSPAEIEGFLREKWDWILRARQKSAERQREREPEREPFPDLHDPSVFNEILDELYPSFQQYLPGKPQLVLRKMKSRWGSCTPSKCKITMNLLLLKAPRHTIRYVMIHELVHFIHANHSPEFYKTFERFLPAYREEKEFLKSLRIL